MYNSFLAPFSLVLLAVVLFFFTQLRTCVRRFLTKKTTILYDLPNLGKAKPHERKAQGTAVICGGSFSGLYAARILSDHFQDVLVVEPESWVNTDEGYAPVFDVNGDVIENGQTHNRARVLQHGTTHALQPLSYKALKQLFPTLDEEVRKADGRIANADFKIHFAGGQIMRPPVTDCPQNFFFSRDAFERLLRRLVVEHSPRIQWLTGTAVNVSVAENDANRLSSVTVRLPDGNERNLNAALVVDCTGTAQAGLKWLKQLDAQPNNSSLNALPVEDLRISYKTVQKTRTYRLRVPHEMRAQLPLPGGYDNATWIYSCIPKFGEGTKSVLVDRIEGHRIRIMLGAWGDQTLPEIAGIRGFLEDFGHDERVPDWVLDIVDLLVENHEGAEVSSVKYPPLSRVRYERAAYLPSNFIAIGDSATQVNPTFAHGCSKACVGAIILDGLLRTPGMMTTTGVAHDFSRRYFKDLLRKTFGAWNATKPIDYLFKTTVPVKGEKLSDGWLMGNAIFTVMLLARSDKMVDTTLYNVVNFLAPPTDFLHPRILSKILFFWAAQQLS